MRRRAGTRTDLDVLETLRARDRDIAARSPRGHMRGARQKSASGQDQMSTFSTCDDAYLSLSHKRRGNRLDPYI